MAIMAGCFVLGLLVIGAALSPSSQALAQDFYDETPFTPTGANLAAEPFKLLNVPGARPVYFAPQDSNGTGTVIFLWNTTDTDIIVPIQSFTSNGLIFIDTEVEVKAFSLLRIIADPIALDPPPSWNNPILVNFTDFSAYAVMYVSKGIKFDGYVVFNPSTGTIDPRIDQGALPLRFSTDPITMFLPYIENN